MRPFHTTVERIRQSSQTKGILCVKTARAFRRCSLPSTVRCAVATRRLRRLFYRRQEGPRLFGWRRVPALAGSVRRWGFVKKRLAFCHVAQDGDGEGALHLDRLPTPAEAATIRLILGVRKRKLLSADALASLRDRFSTAEKRPIAAKDASKGMAATYPLRHESLRIGRESPDYWRPALWTGSQSNQKGAAN